VTEDIDVSLKALSPITEHKRKKEKKHITNRMATQICNKQ
jgi:hypothetical protein